TRRWWKSRPITGWRATERQSINYPQGRNNRCVLFLLSGKFDEFRWNGICQIVLFFRMVKRDSGAVRIGGANGEDDGILAVPPCDLFRELAVGGEMNVLAAQ